MIELNDSAVVRRVESDKTHVALVDAVRAAQFLNRPYWAPALKPLRAQCGVQIPTSSIIMATGAKVRCRTCVYLTGITEQPPSVHERLGKAAS